MTLKKTNKKKLVNEALVSRWGVLSNRETVVKKFISESKDYDETDMQEEGMGSDDAETLEETGSAQKDRRPTHSTQDQKREGGTLEEMNDLGTNEKVADHESVPMGDSTSGKQKGKGSHELKKAKSTGPLAESLNEEGEMELEAEPPAGPPAPPAPEEAMGAEEGGEAEVDIDQLAAELAKFMADKFGLGGGEEAVEEFPEPEVGNDAPPAPPEPVAEATADVREELVNEIARKVEARLIREMVKRKGKKK